MRLIVYCILSMVLATMSCSRSRNNSPIGEGHAARVKNFLSRLKVIPLGYKYDLVLQDNENCYKTSKMDSSYFSEHISVIGFLPDTSRYYNILYLEPGDDLYPSLKVFSKMGKLLGSKSVSYGNCSAGDCGVDSCISLVKVIDKSSIERSLLMISTKCDSLGNKIAGQTSSVKKNQIITIAASGEIEFDIEN